MDSKTKVLSGMLEAQFQYVAGDDEAGSITLERTLKMARGKDLSILRQLPTNIISCLCARALVEDVQTDVVREFIREQRMPAMLGGCCEQWPWPVRLYTLGRFSLVIDGSPMTSSTKAQHRPLELLKLIISLGGRGVNVGRVCDELWPDQEGDAAYKSFTVTLYRLRKMMGNDTVLLSDGKLSLNNQFCWVDSWELQRQLTELEQKCQQGKSGDIDMLTQNVLALYQGHFLGDENSGQPWQLATRERLRSRMLRAILTAGGHLERAGNIESAIAIYQKGLELDELAEDLYRRLMTCMVSEGRFAEAKAVYQRCEKILATLLGIEPSTNTMKVYVNVMNSQNSGLRLVHSRV